MIESIKIENYKCFKDFHLEGLGPFNVLVGPNDSGKTAFLEAVRLVTAVREWSSDRTPAEAIEEKLGLKLGIHAVWRNDSERRIGLKAVGPRPDSQPDWHPTVVVQSDGSRANLFLAEAFADPDEREGRPPGDGLYRELLATIGRAAYFRFDPRALRHASEVGQETMEQTGYGLPSFLVHIMHHDRAAFDQLEAEFYGRFPYYETEHKTITPQTKRVTYADLKRKRFVEKDSYYVLFRTRHDDLLPAENVSDGVMVSLAYIALCHSPDPPNILLIEEPENHVHHASLKDIVGTLRDLTEKKGVQVFLTTHSPYLLDLVEAQDVFVFAKDREGAVAARRLSEYPEAERLKKHFMAGEIWTGASEEDIVFGEGEEEVSTLRVIIYGDGEYDLGQLGREYAPTDDLPALPRLVHRLLSEPRYATYTPVLFREVKGTYRGEFKWAEPAGGGRKWAQKTRQAIRLAERAGFHAAVILIDRDRQPSQDRLAPLVRARDDMKGLAFAPCAVGNAAETFDAWMIVDGKAIGAIEGAATDQTHTAPETLDDVEGTGRHPRDWAARILGGLQGLGGKYAIIAARIELELLKRCCPQGFAPFAAEVEREIAPVTGKRR